MTDFFLGEIRLFASGVVPQGWHLCDGTILQTSTNAALFSLIGNAFGGTAPSTFALPDLRGRAIRGVGTQNAVTTTLGQVGGIEAVALTTANLPLHNHPFQASDLLATTVTVADGLIAKVAPGSSPPYNATAPNIFASTTNVRAIQAESIIPTGGSQAHNNMQPFLVGNYCIATMGLYPPRN